MLSLDSNSENKNSRTCEHYLIREHYLESVSNLENNFVEFCLKPEAYDTSQILIKSKHKEQNFTQVTK